jgi:DNA-binding PucR family transcriptional regulator
LEGAAERIAVGTVAQGLEGIGATGRDALEAARLQDLLGTTENLLTFDDIRLEALFLTEPERARRFVSDELRELGEDDVRVGRLRETALSWLLTGSFVSTAAHLGLHEHTVRNRVAQAEDLLGRTLVSRRTELLVALRLKRLLDAAPPTSR